MKQCVIFDMDGVIINSEPIHQECERNIFRMFGITISEEVHNALAGTTDETLWTRIASLYELPINISEVIQLKRSLYMECLRREASIKPIPYVSQLIAGLYKNNFSLVLASSSPHEQIDHILNNFDLKRFFNSTISGEDVKEGKPHPEIFLKAAESVGVDPSLCVVIEDSHNGVTAAKSANMKCIGFVNPNSGNQDLSKANILINSFKDLSVNSIIELLKFKN